MNRKKEQIQERRESGKARLYRRGQADSVIRLGCNLFAGKAFSACVSSSHLSYFIGISELKRLCFYKKTSGYFLFFPASGYRNYSDGILNASGTNGYGWTSTPNGSNAWNLNFNSGNANMNNNNRAHGFPVRCVQASAPVFVFIKNTFVFFPASGFRNYSDGKLYCSGTQALVWSSVPSGDSAYRLYSSSTGVFVTNVQRTYGFSVRCVQASAAVFVFVRKDIKETSGFFPAAGIRNPNNGSLANSGTEGDGWTSVPSGSNNAYRFILQSGNVSVGNTLRTFGFAVRCVQASAAVGIASIKNTEQIRFRRESGKASLCRRGQADSVTRLGRKLSVGHSFLPCAAPSYSISLIKLLVFKSLYFYKYSSGYSLFFPASGYRHYNDGKLNSSGTNGYAWSSTLSGGKAYNLTFNSGGANLHLNENRGHGFSVRCVQASAAVFVYVRKDIEDTFVFFPASGNRNPSSGNLGNSGLSGYGWTSVPNGGNAWYLDVFPSNARVLDNVSGGYGFPVRCVQVSVAVWAVQKENIKQIRYRRESGKEHLCRRGQADSVTRLGRKLSVGHSFLPCAAPSYLFTLIKLPVFDCLYFYKYSSGYFLFFPASGYRGYSDGKLNGSGTYGYGWTSTPNGSNAWYLDLWSSIARVYSHNRGYGFPVRCVQVSAPVFVFANDTFVFFPASGFRAPSDGKLDNSDSVGYFWVSTTAGGGYAYSLYAPSGTVRVANHVRNDGFSVRCVQASAPVFAFIKETFVFFPATGYRGYDDGKLIKSGTWGYEWVSTLGVSGAWGLDFSPAGLGLYDFPRSCGFPVRCVQASAAVFVLPAKSFKCFRTYTDIVNDTLAFFPASGNRRYDDGRLDHSGIRGYGWSSLPIGGNAWHLDFYFSYVSMGNHSRGYGFPVRCVQGSAAVWAVRKENIKQIRYRRESGKACLCRRGQADSVTRLGRKLSAGNIYLPDITPSYVLTLIRILHLTKLCFYKHSSGYSLFFPAAGIRNYNDGSLRNSGGEGDGWTSTPYNSENAYRFILNSGNANMSNTNRTYGFPVRCVQASAAVFAFSNDTFCFFSVSGYRHFTDGKRGGSGALGYGWTLTPGGGNNAWYLDFFSSYARVNNYDRGHGFTVRCVQASATVFAFSNDTFVFFPAAGIRNNTDGSLTNSGIEGDGWTSVPDGNNAFRLIFKSGYAYVTSVTRMYGFPVRCVQASAAVFAFIKETFVFFPATGYRHYSNGGFYNSGTWGYWWTSTPGNDGKAWRLHVQPGASQMVADWCTYGFPVRCVQASAAVFSGIENDLKQIRFRRESGKVRLCRRGRADSVTRLGRKLSAGNICLPGAAPSHVLTLIRILLLIRLCFYKHSSGYSLFFPATGYRNYNDGSLRDTGKEGDGWTSTPSGNNGSYLRFLSGIAHVNNNNRGNGFPVRCVQASATVFAAGVNKNQIINVDETVM